MGERYARGGMSRDVNYSDDEVRAIIDRALRNDLGGGAVSHEELVAAGAEVGISREALELAARDVRAKRQVEELKLRVIRRRRRALVSHLSVYVIVNAFLFMVNFLTTPGQWWFLFSVLGWGLGLIFHAKAGLSREVSERSLRRERQRLLSEQRFESEFASATPGARASGSVQERVGRILTKAAAEIRGTSDTSRRPGVRVDSRGSEAEPPEGEELPSTREHRQSRA